MTLVDTFFQDYLEKISRAVCDADTEGLLAATRLVLAARMAGGKVVVVGNGGSAAISSHVSVDFTKAANVRSVNFNEADLLTCYSNDYGYENWVTEALRSFCDPRDLVILISSSGESNNIINAASYCNKNGIDLVTFSGFHKSNRLRKLGKINLFCDSESYNVVETAHQTWLLSIVDSIVELGTDLK